MKIYLLKLKYGEKSLRVNIIRLTQRVINCHAKRMNKISVSDTQRRGQLSKFKNPEVEQVSEGISFFP